MAAITYIAKRRLIAGHSASTQYSIDVELAEIIPADNLSAKEHVALGGNTETVFNRLDEIWNCQTVPLTNTERDEVREFLGSAVDGQYITFDAYGTVASPDNAQTAVLMSKNHQPTRLGKIDLWTYSFTVRVVE